MRHRRPRPQHQPWERDWRNPDMKVLRSWMEISPMGFVNKVTEEITPQASSELSAEAVDDPQQTTSFRHDPSYYWAREARRKRKNR